MCTWLVSLLLLLRLLLLLLLLFVFLVVSICVLIKGFHSSSILVGLLHVLYYRGWLLTWRFINWESGSEFETLFVLFPVSC